MKVNSYLCVIDPETGSEKLSDFPQITQPVNDGVRIDSVSLIATPTVSAPLQYPKCRANSLIGSKHTQMPFFCLFKVSRNNSLLLVFWWGWGRWIRVIWNSINIFSDFYVQSSSENSCKCALCLQYLSTPTHLAQCVLNFVSKLSTRSCHSSD